MTAPTQPVTINLADFGGAAAAGIVVTARMDAVDYTAAGVFVGTKPVTGTTNASGTVVLNLFPNAVSPTGLGTKGTKVRVTATMPNGRALDVMAKIPDTPCNLVNVLVDDEPVSLSAAEAALAQTQSAAATATTQAGIATTQAGIATTQAGIATTQAGIATTKADEATTQAGIATTKAGLANADAAAAAASRAAIDNRIYPDTYGTAPTTRPDGSAIQNGDQYLGADGYSYARISGAWVNQTSAAAASAASASTSAGTATTANTDAQAALVATQLARDIALGTARLYATTAAALADGALAVGQYFAAISSSSNEVALLYLKAAGPVATDTGKRIPTADAVLKPAFAGKKNGWPDTFFRNFDTATVTQYGATRWKTNSGGSSLPSTTFTKVANAVFDGYALRRTADLGTTLLHGPLIQLSDLGLTTGDTLTVVGMFVGTGAAVSFSGRFYDASNAAVGGQVNAVDETGATATVTGATAKWMRHEQVVPATATNFWLYPYTLTAGQTFDLVALFCFKGAASTGPVWPTLSDPNNHAYEIAALDTRLDAAELTILTIANGTPALNYAVTSYGVVSAAATSITLDGTGYGNNPRDLVFMGWGERYTPAAVSFNAVKIKSISRTSGTAAKWRTLRVVVRTGANSHLAGSTVVAVGSTTVLEASDTLTDVTILLKDPTTGVTKTLTDADFTGGEYFIGVYAETSTGSPAGCGEPRGTMANSLLQSYYHTSTTNNGKTGGWTATTAGSNARLGFQHLLLTTPVESVSYQPGPQLAADLASQATPPAPEIVMPPYVYGVQGRECNVYFDNLFPADPDEYLIGVTQTGNLGKQQTERWTWTPAGAVAAGTLTVAAHDKRTGNQLASAVAQLRSAASAAGTGLTKKVMAVGDSLVNGGIITQTLLDIAGLGDPMAITLLGTRGAGSNKHEGRSGWSIDTYTSNYSDGTYGANPFWIGGAVNYPQYLIDNGLPTPDWVIIHLGINDSFGQSTDAGVVAKAATEFAKQDVLIASMKAAGAGVKVALAIPSPPSFSQDSFGNDYGVTKTRWRFKRNILLWARELITKYAGQEANRIYLIPSNTSLDTVNNMATTAVAVNSRNATIVNRQSNGVHPAASGYQQIGDAWWAFLKYYAAA